MNSELLDNNVYINEILKSEISPEYKQLNEKIHQNLVLYFHKNYKKIRYEDFVDTNDYHIQKIRYFMTSIQTIKHLDIDPYGQLLQNFIFAIEKPLMLSADNKMIKSTVSNVRSFLIKNKQQNAMILRIEIIESKSKINHDYLLLLEKICLLIKMIYDVAKISTNIKYKTYQLVSKLLSEEKFLEEKKMTDKKNKIIRTKTTDDMHICSMKLEKIEIKSRGEKIYLRSNTGDDEDEINNDLFIENMESRNKEGKSCNTKIDIFHTEEPLESYRQINLGHIHLHPIPNGAIGRYNSQIGFLDSHWKNPLVNELNEKSDVMSMLSNGMETDRQQDTSVQIRVVEKNKKKHVKIKYIKGDENIECIDEKSFNDIFNEILCSNPIETNLIKRKSCLINLIEKDQFNIIRERSPTPVKGRRESNIRSNSPHKRSKSNERVSTIISVNGKDIQVMEKPVLELMSDQQQALTISKCKIQNLKKIYPIISSNDSPIKVPDGYVTDDNDLKLLCDLINEPVTAKLWKKVYDKPGINIYTKSVEGSPNILIKTTATIDGFTKQEIFDAISDVNIRKQWDNVFSEFKIVETNNQEQWEVLYMSIKSPSVWVTARDFVQKRKIWKDFPDGNSHILHFKSVDHPLCPEKPKFVRAETIISGYFIKTLSVYPAKTFVSIISQTNIKGMIPAWLVNQVAKTAPKEWLDNLTKGCEKVRANKK